MWSREKGKGIMRTMLIIGFVVWDRQKSIKI